VFGKPWEKTEMFIFKTKYVLSFLFNYNRQSVSSRKAADAVGPASLAEATGLQQVFTISAFFLLFFIQTNASDISNFEFEPVPYT